MTKQYSLIGENRITFWLRFFFFLSFCALTALRSKANVFSGPEYHPPQFIVTGKVTDALTKQPLSGATIAIQGTSSAVAAKTDGTFSINVPADKAILVISFTGYATQRIPVEGAKFLDVVLSSDNKLNEVIIVGYGQQSKARIVGSIGTVKGEEITKSNAGNLTNSLIGRVPGVITMQNSSEPGSDGAQILIRGRATLNNNSPLVMVDGIQRDFSQIDPNEIQSVSVLKDASAVAIYGVRGGNGVILVTTKRGVSGKPTFNYTGYYGFQNPTQEPKYLNSYDYARLYNEAQLNDDPTATPRYTAEDLQKYKDHSDPFGHPDVNWFKTIITPNAPQRRNSLSVSGGSDRIKYFIAFGDYDQKGMYRTVDFKKNDLRINLDAELTKTTSLSVGTYGNFQRKTEPGVPNGSTDGEGIYAVVTYIPNNAFPVRNEDGSLASIWGQNPVGDVNQSGYIKKNNTEAQTSFTLNQKLDFVTPGLSAKVIYAKDLGYNHDKSWLLSYNSYSRSNGTLQPQLNRASPELDEVYGEYDNSTFETHLDYKRDFGKHQIGALILYSQSQFKTDTVSASRVQYVSTAVSQLNAGPVANLTNGGTAAESAVEGVVGRFNYAYDRKYLLEASFGYNGSDNFPTKKRFGFFPAVAAGWVVSNESFFSEAVPFITNLKLRASYGQVGNDKVGGRRFLYIPTAVFTSGYTFGNQPVQGIALGNPANPDVTWERANKTNIGIDIDTKGSFLSFRADVFFEQRSNILGTRIRSVPGTYGFALPVENYATVNNHGFELEVNHRGAIGNFNYYAGVNYTFARNKVVNIDEPAGIPSYQQQTGKPLGQFFGYIAEGFYQNQQDVDSHAKIPGVEPMPGDIKYKDLNGDNKIDNLDITAIGKSDIPENVFGLSFGGSYKGFDFSVLMQGAAGYTVNYKDGILEFVYNSQAWEYQLDHWTPQTPDAAYPRLSLSQYNYKQESSTFWAKNAAYVRMKNASLGYNFPSTILPKGISKLRVYLTATNLWTWSKVPYFDPEAPSGFPYFYPQQKGVFAGVNLTF
jgi:TonB-linked SusC/RagA family outer membrane protein